MISPTPQLDPEIHERLRRETVYPESFEREDSDWISLNEMLGLPEDPPPKAKDGVRKQITPVTFQDFDRSDDGDALPDYHRFPNAEMDLHNSIFRPVLTEGDLNSRDSRSPSVHSISEGLPFVQTEVIHQLARKDRSRARYRYQPRPTNVSSGTDKKPLSGKDANALRSARFSHSHLKRILPSRYVIQSLLVPTEREAELKTRERSIIGKWLGSSRLRIIEEKKKVLAEIKAKQALEAAKQRESVRVAKRLRERQQQVASSTEGNVPGPSRSVRFKVSDKGKGKEIASSAPVNRAKVDREPRRRTPSAKAVAAVEARVGSNRDSVLDQDESEEEIEAEQEEFVAPGEAKLSSSSNTEAPPPRRRRGKGKPKVKPVMAPAPAETRLEAPGKKKALTIHVPTPIVRLRFKPSPTTSLDVPPLSASSSTGGQPGSGSRRSASATLNSDNDPDTPKGRSDIIKKAWITRKINLAAAEARGEIYGTGRGQVLKPGIGDGREKE